MLRDEFSIFKTKLDNYNYALELISQKINKLSLLYNRKKNFSKLSSTKNINKCAYKTKFSEKARSHLLLIKKLFLINLRSIQVMQKLYEENIDLHQILNDSNDFIKKQSQLVKKLQESLIMTEKVCNSQIFKSKISDEFKTLTGKNLYLHLNY